VSSTKKEIIVGAVIVIIVILWLINVGMSTIESNSLSVLSLSASINNLISWLLTIVAVAGIAGGLLLISQSDKPEIKRWMERYTVRATIPAYFISALVPLIMGLLLLIMLGQTTWGLGLAYLSVPSTLIFLIFGLSKKNQS
jgi:hypothetical protein